MSEQSTVYPLAYLRQRTRILTPEEQDEFIHFLMQGAGLRMAAMTLGLEYESVEITCAALPRFNMRIHQARALVHERVEHALLTRCLEDKNLRAIEFWLVNKKPSDWTHNGSGQQVAVGSSVRGDSKGLNGSNGDGVATLVEGAQKILQSKDPSVLDSAIDTFERAYTLEDE